MIHTSTILPSRQPLRFRLDDGREFVGTYDGHEFRVGKTHYPVCIVVGWDYLVNDATAARALKTFFQPERKAC